MGRQRTKTPQNQHGCLRFCPKPRTHMEAEEPEVREIKMWIGSRKMPKNDMFNYDNVLTPLFFLRHALLQTMAHFSWHFWHAVRHIEWHTRTHPPVRFECITTPPVVSIRHHDSRTNRINSELFILIYKNIQKETIWNILSLCLRVIGRNTAFYQDISKRIFKTVILFRNI